MSPIDKLRDIRRVIQSGEMTELSHMTGIHVSVISTYLNHAGKIVMKPNKVRQILLAWDKIEDNKFRNY